MESENQELVVESFPFEQSDLRDPLLKGSKCSFMRALSSQLSKLDTAKLCTKPNIYTGIYKYLHKWLKGIMRQDFIYSNKLTGS
jgi:hypothetical protein